MSPEVASCPCSAPIWLYNLLWGDYCLCDIWRLRTIALLFKYRRLMIYFKGGLEISLETTFSVSSVICCDSSWQLLVRLLSDSFCLHQSECPYETTLRRQVPFDPYEPVAVQRLACSIHFFTMVESFPSFSWICILLSNSRTKRRRPDKLYGMIVVFGGWGLRFQLQGMLRLLGKTCLRFEESSRPVWTV